MVATRGKKKTASPDNNLEEKETTENGLAETEFSDSLTADVVEPNEGTQFVDGVGLVADEAINENSGEMTGEEGGKVDREDPSMSGTKPNDDDSKAESEENTIEGDEIDDHEVDDEDPSMPVTKPNGDDSKAESEENTIEGDEIDDHEVDGEDPSMPVTKPNADDSKAEPEENTIEGDEIDDHEVEGEDPSMPVKKPNGDDSKAESEEIDDHEDVLFEVEDEEEHFEHNTEERILAEYDVSEEEASEEDDGDAEVGEEDAIEEDEVSEEEAAKEENNQEEREKAIQDKREAKGKEVGGGAKQHDIEKSEAILKNIKKSNEKTRMKKAQPSRLKKVNSQDKPESSQKRKVNKRVESMGMIFMCSSETKKDCYQYKVLGLPESKKDIVEKIYTGMRLFLYDVDLKLMYGIYKAAGPGGYNLEPTAFKRQFPSQVRFKVVENCLPLAEEKFKTIIKANYFTRTKFDCKLNSEQVKKLCKLFTVSSKGQPSKKLGRGLKTEKQHIRQDKNKRQRTGDKRSLPLREDGRHPERPRKRQKKVINPVPRQRVAAAPLPTTVPSSYVYSRADDYRRDKPLIPLDPYSGARDPPRERHEHRDGRDPHLERRYVYRGGLDSHRDRPGPYIDDVESYSRRRDPDPYRIGRDLFLEPRDLYRDGRDPYIERRDSYRDGQDTYIERRDSYRDGRAAYLEDRVAYGDGAHSELYSTYRRPLYDSRDIYREDRGVELRDSYRRDEILGRRVLPPLDSNRHDVPGRDAYLPDRMRPSYAESLYLSTYPSRADVYRL